MTRTQIHLACYALVLGLTLTHAAWAADPTLVGWWRLDDGTGTTAADSSGRGNTGTVVGSPAWTTDGKLGGALQFSASGYVDCGSDSSLALGDAVSMAAWIKVAAVGIDHKVGGNQNNANGGYKMSVYSNNKVEFEIRTSANSAVLNRNAAGGTVFEADVWYHVVGEYSQNDGFVRTYVNGVLDRELATTEAMGVSPGPFRIGCEPFTPGSYNFNGVMDDVRVYSRAVAAEEISTIMLGTPPGPALGPRPGLATTDVPRDVVLGWTPGEYAETHDVYLGTVFDDVNAADRANPRGVQVSQGQDANTYDPTGLLAFGQTYYWRVDEVNAAPDLTTFKGDVWSFTSEAYGYAVKPVKATASSSSNALMGPEKTIDGSGLSASDEHSVSASHMWLSKKGSSPIWIKYDFDKVYKLHQMWVWNSNQATEPDVGLGAKEVTVETSLDGTTWTALGDAMEFAQATGEPNYVHNTTVEFGGVEAKYVRLTIANNWSDGTKMAGLAEVRFFYVPVKAFGPTPAAGATGVAIDAVLNWRPGREAVQHQVYLGTDPNALALVKTVTAHSLGLGSLGLQYGKTYYWKVTEVNDAATPSSWEGDVWSFSIPDSFIVDDFEKYNDTCNRVFFAWTDGLGYSELASCGASASNGNGTGSMVGNAKAPFAEQTIVLGGKQSMPMAYDNTSGKGYSEAIRTLDPSQDWTAGGVKTLVVHFYGSSDNGAGQLYVKINGVRVDYTGNAAALTTAVWKQWNIDLTSVSGLQAVKTLAIGVSGTGKGILYIDDILLYRVASAVAVPVDPGTGNLSAYYPLDGTANDGSGHGYNGTAMGNQTYADAPAGRGKAIQLNGTNDYVDIPTLGTLVSTLSSATLTAWVNVSVGDGAWPRIFDFGTGSTDYMMLTPHQDTTGPMTCDIRVTTTALTVAQTRFAASRALPTGWHHVGVVFDGVAMNVKVYVDGTVVASGVTTVLPKDLGKTTQNWLGRSQFTSDAYFTGSLDDFRIYNRALSEGELRYLAGDR